MITSKYVQGKSIPSFDEKISNWIAKYKFDGGGHDMVVAIENTDGEVYRIITSVGMKEYMDVVSFIGKIGLDDILADSVCGANGFDSRFVVPQKLKV